MCASFFSHYNITGRRRERHQENNWDFHLFNSASVDPLFHLIQPHYVKSSINFCGHFVWFPQYVRDLWFVNSLTLNFLFLLMWWLILWINLTRPPGAQTFSQALFCVFLWGCFWMGLKEVDWVKPTSFLNVDGPQPNSWRPKKKKRLTLPKVKKKPSDLMVFELGPWLLSCLKTWTETSAFLGSQIFQPSDWKYTVDFPSSDTFRLKLGQYHLLL